MSQTHYPLTVDPDQAEFIVRAIGCYLSAHFFRRIPKHELQKARDLQASFRTISKRPRFAR